MGDAQSIPVIGEVVTAVDSAAKITAAGVCGIVGQTDAANKYVEEAGKSWVNYSEKSVIAAPVRAGIHYLDGDTKEAKRVYDKMGGTRALARTLAAAACGGPLAGLASSVGSSLMAHGDGTQARAWARGDGTLAAAACGEPLAGLATVGSLMGHGNVKSVRKGKGCVARTPVLNAAYARLAEDLFEGAAGAQKARKVNRSLKQGSSKAIAGKGKGATNNLRKVKKATKK